MKPNVSCYSFNPLNAELNPICYLLALLEAHYIFHVSRIRVKDGSELVTFVTYGWLQRTRSHVNKECPRLFQDKKIASAVVVTACQNSGLSVLLNVVCSNWS